MNNRVLITNPIKIEDFDHLKSLIENKETKYFVYSESGPQSGCYEISYNDEKKHVIAERSQGYAVLNDEDFKEEFFSNIKGAYYVSSYFYVDVFENNALWVSYSKEAEYLKHEVAYVENINEKLEKQGFNLDEHIFIVDENSKLDDGKKKYKFSEELKNKLREILDEYMIDSEGRRF